MCQNLKQIINNCKKVARRTSSSSCIEDFTGVLRPHFSSTTPTRILFTAPPPTSKPLAVIGRDSAVVVFCLLLGLFVALLLCLFVLKRHCWAGENARPRPLYLCPVGLQTKMPRPWPTQTEETRQSPPTLTNSLLASHRHSFSSYILMIL